MTSWTEAIYSCSEGVPPFLGDTLNELYGARYACLPHMRVYGSWDQVHAYIARRSGVAAVAYLYRCKGGKATVLNEGIAVSEEEANRFAACIFRTHRKVSRVAFHFVEANAQRFAFPFQRAACAQDLVLPLPSTVDDYTASLGSSTRATLRNRQSRIRRELPGFHLHVLEKEAAVGAVGELIGLHRLRMQSMHMASHIDAAEEQRIVDVVAECGFITVARCQGALCGGAVTYRLGRNFSARILAHDPRFDAYRMGFVCAYLTICECIRQGGSKLFYFGWGQSDYKSNLGGRERQLYHLSIFRSRLHVVGNAGAAIAALLRASVYHARRWLAVTARKDDAALARLAEAIISGWRWLRQPFAFGRKAP